MESKEKFFKSLSGKVIVIGGCGTVGSLIARVLACHDIDVTILDSAKDTYLETIFTRDGINLELNHDITKEALIDGTAIFIAPSLLNNESFQKKLSKANSKNLPVYSINEILTYFKAEKPVFAVTGTNGKTTTTHTLKNIFKVNDYVVPEHELSIQGNSEFIPALQSRLNGDVGILEIGTFGNSGEILRSATNSGVNTGIITNITRDHLINGSFDDYVNCKKEMIKVADTLILDGDDPIVSYLSSEEKDKKIYYFGFKDEDNDLFNKKLNKQVSCPVCGKKLKYNINYLSHLGQYECSCGFKNPELDVYASDIEIIKEGNITKTRYNLHISSNIRPVTLTNSGVHNVYNSLAAACGAWVGGVDLDGIVKGLESFMGVAGRLEYIHKDPTIIIDFAHNPAGIETIVQTVGKLKTSLNKIIVINTISSESGKEGDLAIANLLSDVDIVIPVSTPSNEVSNHINAEVRKIKSVNFNKTGTIGSSFKQVKEGIKLALEIASSDDIILIVGEAGVKYSKKILDEI